jgi:pyridoxamine 5'-phosphate oxidase family protein
MFSKAELEYLRTQRLARVATANSKGVPEVSPVGFQFDGGYFWIGSHSQDIFYRTRRYKNIIGGNRRVGLVVDDLASVDPWRPRGVKVSGVAEVLDHDGMFGPGKYIRVTPTLTASWGIEPSPQGGPSVKRWGA